MSRMQGRGRGRGGRGHFGRGQRGKSSSKFGSNNSSKPVKTKLEDHVFHLGTARQASDYDSNVKFIINHIQQEFDRSADIVTALEDLEHPDYEKWKPDMDDFKSTKRSKEEREAEDEMLKVQYGKSFDIYLKRKTTYDDNKGKAYAVIWARCSPQMQSQLESRDDFLTKIKRDPIALLKAIKQHALN